MQPQRECRDLGEPERERHLVDRDIRGASNSAAVGRTSSISFASVVPSSRSRR